MPAEKKVLLDYKLDPNSKLGEFVKWFEVANQSINPDSGRRRKGDAKKAIKLYLESVLTGVQTKEYNDFTSNVKQFQEDTKLPKELQSAKNNLSVEDYENFKSLYEKLKKEEEKNKTE